jgi:glycerol-3-phosphate dehydrogenase (NAD(P)+)
VASILILGAGVMGSAIAVPAADNGHSVRLVGTPLDAEIIAKLKRPGGLHPKLDAALPAGVEPLAIEELGPAHFAQADAIVVGVSSRGLDWAAGLLSEHLDRPCPVAFVTKGLAVEQAGVKTYADTVPARVGNLSAFVGIGGPCIARELANRWPTASVYASADASATDALIRLMQTDYYRLSPSGDAVGVEACAALKNFYAIGVSAMQTRFPDTGRASGAHAKNPLAALFNQAAREMAALCEALGGKRETAFDLAGMGDLHVTVGGGRNSRLGHGLGQGRRVSEVLGAELAGETVEGADTARALAVWLRSGSGMDAKALPLAHAIIDAVLDDRPFDFDFRRIGGPAVAA